MKNTPITVSLLLAAATQVFSPSSAGESAGAAPPDITAGGRKDDSHDWLLGPTGLRGWTFFRHEDLTAEAELRQLKAALAELPEGRRAQKGKP